MAQRSPIDPRYTARAYKQWPDKVAPISTIQARERNRTPRPDQPADFQRGCRETRERKLVYAYARRLKEFWMSTKRPESKAEAKIMGTDAGIEAGYKRADLAV